MKKLIMLLSVVCVMISANTVFAEESVPQTKTEQAVQSQHRLLPIKLLYHFPAPRTPFVTVIVSCQTVFSRPES